MNRHTLLLKVNQRPEALERVIRVTRHRGFTVQTMNMQSYSPDQFQLQLEVESSRPITLLYQQLTKLVDVQKCQSLPKVKQSVPI